MWARLKALSVTTTQKQAGPKGGYIVKAYQVKAYCYLVGPFKDPISNMRYSRKTKAAVVYETDVLMEAVDKAEQIEKEDPTAVAYVIRTSDGAQWAGGVWLD